MKKLLAMIAAICIFAGIPDLFSVKVIDILSDTSYSVVQKKIAIEIVAEQLEDIYQRMVNGEEIYSRK